MKAFEKWARSAGVNPSDERRACWDAALEQAAKACDRYEPSDRRRLHQRCAEDIRAMKSVPSEGQEIK